MTLMLDSMTVSQHGSRPLNQELLRNPLRGAGLERQATAVRRQPELRQPRGKRLERDPPFEPSYACSDAAMDPTTEGDVMGRVRPLETIFPRRLKFLGIEVTGGEDNRDARPGRDGDAADFDLALGLAPD